ncbi:MAG: hypothetical protein C0599_05545 [Salinivirgaceae bacterium]|nr:MAG: hypothetical protein C0599_05545 [Salinivirgaceae bacterium]
MMNEAFRYITPVTYFLIVVIWLYIIVFYFKRFRQRQKEDKLFNLLLFILAIDAFRTIFEGVYFGIRHSALAGFLPESVFTVLSKPQYVFLPKVVTFLTGILVLIIVLYRWMPAELKQKKAMRKLVEEKNKMLINQNAELLKAKERAEESDKLKTAFLNNMSHEIRTPMNGIVGFSKLLNNAGLSSKKREYYTQIIENSSTQLLQVINDILEISTLGTKQVMVEESEFNLNELFSEVYAIHKIKADEQNIALNIIKGLPDGKSMVKSDKMKILKALNNLIENAIKFTSEGYVEFGYQVVDNDLIIHVKDTGIGISTENFEKIFGRFSQEEKSTSKLFGGLGLGLSIAKENAELIGGKITLESIKGKGTTFYLNIPFVSAG